MKKQNVSQEVKFFLKFTQVNKNKLSENRMLDNEIAKCIKRNKKKFKINTS